MGRLDLCSWILIAFALVSYVSADCIWYDQCGASPQNPDHKLNCLYNGPPKKFTSSEGLKKFQLNCPDLYTGKDTLSCCSDKQIITLDSQVAVPKQTLQRCPSCYHNFLNVWCDLTCAPNQAEFMTVNKTIQVKYKDKNVTAIAAVNYALTNDFGVGMFNSCRNVQMPSSNSPALSILCGTSASKCTPKGWLDYMGSTANQQAPFDIFFYMSNNNVTVNGTNLKPLNTSVVPCNKAVSNTSNPCSCQDCKASCSPTPPPPPPTKPCEIFHLDCYVFGFTIFFATFLLLFGCYSICYNVMVQDSLRLESHGEDDSDSNGCWSRSVGQAATRNERKRNYLENLSEDQLGRCDRIGAALEMQLERWFRKWGYMIATRPYLVIVITLVVGGILCAGVALFQVTTDPVKLWSAPTSRARTELDYYNDHFVPFYRTEQIIISRPHNKTVVVHPFKPPSSDSENFTNLFDLTFLHQMLDLQLQVEALQGEHDGGNVTLTDICYAPLSPDNNNCTIQSVLNYYQNDHKMLDKVAMDSSGFFVNANYLDHFDYCVQSPTSLNDTTDLHTPCLGTYGGPVFPWVALGGYEESNYRSAKALVITFVVNNHEDESKNAPAEAWEKVFIEFMKNYTKEHPDISISFSSERSIEDELNRESESDVTTILISYMIMFAYITITLGQYQGVGWMLFDCKFGLGLMKVIRDAKILVGLAGVIIVLLSVGASLGFYSYIGIPSTLIIVEVVPFLVLAVGVDNIFILVQALQREERKDGESTESMVARVVGSVGPSMLLTSLSESMAFFLGALTNMPAVKVFSLYAAMAVLFDFLLQISIFIALLSLDCRRMEAQRLDVCFAKVKLPKVKKPSKGILYNIVEKYYSHWLMKEWVRPIIMVIFVGYFCASGAMVSKVGIGLDQSLSMPRDSYVLNYFKNITTYLSVGAPVYFVVRGGQDYSTFLDQNKFCGISGCPQDSLVQQIDTSALIPKYTHIAEPVSSWLDDYFAWMSSSPCCRYINGTDTFCPSTSTDPRCVSCVIKKADHGRPVGEEFYQYLHWFLQDNPGLKCAKGGHAAYGSGVELYNNTKHQTRVGATYFMTYHSVLKTSSDYINALKEARKIAKNITQAMNLPETEVFPYSIFYVFYEQYLTIVEDSVFNLSLCMAAIFVISTFLLGFDVYAAIMVIVTILMILVDMIGMMYLWDIDLNALSLVNLIMAIGISVEFCSHIVRAFTISVQATRKERAKEALSHMGSSVLSGITLTKLGGIIVLSFSKSQLFQVFYFRMYLGMVIFGATHGLIFLPVFLSYIGPPVSKAKYFHKKKMEGQYSNSGEDQGYVNGAYDNPPNYATVAHTQNQADRNRL